MSGAPKLGATRAPSTHERRQPGTPNGELFTKTDSETGDVTTYYYDGLGNLLSVDLPDGSLIEYVIDGQNRRIGKKVDGVLTKAWLYKDQLKPVAELDGAGNLVGRFVYGSKSNVPDVVMKYNAGLVTTYRVISDHLGSPIMAVNVNNSSDVPFRAEYSAFGERNLTSAASSGDWMPFGFAGGIDDADTGLTRFGARDYDAVIGRWVSKDPMRFAAGLGSLYSYVGSDALNTIDPTGRDTYSCTRPLKGWPGQIGPFYHEYACVVQGNNVICGGFGPSGSILGSPGQATSSQDDYFDESRCKERSTDNTCMDECVASTAQSSDRPWYDIRSNQCQDWTESLVEYCRSACS